VRVRAFSPIPASGQCDWGGASEAERSAASRRFGKTDRIPVAPRCDREERRMARDGGSDSQAREDLRSDIDALEEMIVRLLADPRITDDGPLLLAARTVLERRREELARTSPDV
jgi:hypothetical protein